jgi:hypothetical protein
VCFEDYKKRRKVMKIKRAILLLTVISLVAVPVLAKPPGALGPPDLLSIVQTTATIDEVPDVDVFLLDWTDVVGADKYSVDITALAICDTGAVDELVDPILIEIELSASFGTSDRLDGGVMSDSYLNIPVSDVEALAADLDYLLDLLLYYGIIVDVESVEISAKVKALDPSVKPTKRQNNPFSNSLPIVLL